MSGHWIDKYREIYYIIYIYYILYTYLYIVTVTPKKMIRKGETVVTSPEVLKHAGKSPVRSMLENPRKSSSKTSSAMAMIRGGYPIP